MTSPPGNLLRAAVSALEPSPGNMSGRVTPPSRALCGAQVWLQEQRLSGKSREFALFARKVAERPGKAASGLRQNVAPLGNGPARPASRQPRKDRIPASTITMPMAKPEVIAIPT
jgi:hypothetical protein